MNKKIISILAILSLCIVTFTGCSKHPSTKSEIVKVKIVDACYKPPKKHYVATIRGIPQTHIDAPALYEITVEYEDAEYSINDETTYKIYSDRIGNIVQARLVTETYSDGNVKQWIDHLGGLYDE